VRYIPSIIKGGLIVVCSVIFSTLSIDATDSFRTTQSLLSQVIIGIEKNPCKDGTAAVVIRDVLYCVDIYEAQVGEECPVSVPGAVTETASNIMHQGCAPITKPGELPWRFVTEAQAKQLCALAKKRLITSEVWYEAALGTPTATEACALSTSLSVGGNHPQCLSGSGIYDMVGNVWELVDGAVVGNYYDTQQLPPSGYVASAGYDGIATESTSTPAIVMGGDYIWTTDEPNVRSAIMRGGFYGSRDDGGIYATHAAVSPDAGSAAIGFRCMYIPL
jgi:hypothetical protein